jgi:hypothetical protein
MTIPLPSPAQSIGEMDRLIRAAIRGRHTLRAIYDGKVRLLCPHMLGRNREGQVRVLCLQVGGESASRLQRKEGAGDWRCMALEKFSSVAVAEAAWQTAGSSLRRPKCIEQMELEVTDQPGREREPPQ